MFSPVFTDITSDFKTFLLKKLKKVWRKEEWRFPSTDLEEREKKRKEKKTLKYEMQVWDEKLKTERRPHLSNLFRVVSERHDTGISPPTWRVPRFIVFNVFNTAANMSQYSSPGSALNAGGDFIVSERQFCDCLSRALCASPEKNRSAAEKFLQLLLSRTSRKQNSIKVAPFFKVEFSH